MGSSAAKRSNGFDWTPEEVALIDATFGTTHQSKVDLDEWPSVSLYPHAAGGVAARLYKNRNGKEMHLSVAWAGLERVWNLPYCRGLMGALDVLAAVVRSCAGSLEFEVPRVPKVADGATEMPEEW